MSLRVDSAQAAFNMLVGVMQKPALRPLLIGQPLADSLMIRHPTGRAMEIAVVAGARAGGSLVSRWSFGVAGDEAPRMQTSADGMVVNWDDSRAAVHGRLLPGAQILEPGSPWAPQGTIYSLCSQHWQHPSEHIVVLHGRGPQLNPAWWTPKRCTDLEKRNPAAYVTDVEAEFSDAETSLFSALVIERQTRESPLDLPYDPGYIYSAAADPATRGNSWTLTIIGRPRAMQFNEAVRYRVAVVRQWTG